MSLNNLSPINQKFVQKTIENKEKAAQNPTTSSVKKIDKKKLAVGIAAGVGITALVIGGILYNRKVNSKAVKQLAEHIDFHSAETLDEAIKFGMENLGIKKYKGFKEADLDVVNYINNGLVDVNNKMKGKAVMPKKIKYVNSLANVNGDACVNGFGTMTFAKDSVKYMKDFVYDYLKKHTNAEDKIISDITNDYSKTKNVLANIAKKDKIFSKVNHESKTGRIMSKFNDIYHEMGHLQHKNNIDSDLYFQLTNYDSSKTDLTDSAKKLFDLFNKSKDMIQEKVSGYATTTPGEFVAEVYNGLCSNMKFDDNVLDLYQKLGGVMI